MLTYQFPAFSTDEQDALKRAGRKGQEFEFAMKAWNQRILTCIEELVSEPHSNVLWLGHWQHIEQLIHHFSELDEPSQQTLSRYRLLMKQLFKVAFRFPSPTPMEEQALNNAGGRGEAWNEAVQNWNQRIAGLTSPEPLDSQKGSGKVWELIEHLVETFQALPAMVQTRLIRSQKFLSDLGAFHRLKIKAKFQADEAYVKAAETYFQRPQTYSSPLRPPADEFWDAYEFSRFVFQLTSSLRLETQALPFSHLHNKLDWVIRGNQGFFVPQGECHRIPLQKPSYSRLLWGSSIRYDYYTNPVLSSAQYVEACCPEFKKDPGVPYSAQQWLAHPLILNTEFFIQAVAAEKKYLEEALLQSQTWFHQVFHRQTRLFIQEKLKAIQHKENELQANLIRACELGKRLKEDVEGPEKIMFLQKLLDVLGCLPEAVQKQHNRVHLKFKLQTEIAQLRLEMSPPNWDNAENPQTHRKFSQKKFWQPLEAQLFRPDVESILSDPEQAKGWFEKTLARWPQFEAPAVDETLYLHLFSWMVFKSIQYCVTEADYQALKPSLVRAGHFLIEKADPSSRPFVKEFFVALQKPHNGSEPSILSPLFDLAQESYNLLKMHFNDPRTQNARDRLNEAQTVWYLKQPYLKRVKEKGDQKPQMNETLISEVKGTEAPKVPLKPTERPRCAY